MRAPQTTIQDVARKLHATLAAVLLVFNYPSFISEAANKTNAHKIKALFFGREKPDDVLIPVFPKPIKFLMIVSCRRCLTLANKRKTEK
ncbi:MAG TPA: hypothetical protein VFL47_10960 [Flavisolibacter sp.]|nr:hypothetical protein [Flavisolibacter sp.]